MLMNVDLEQLNEGDGLEATMKRYHASRHKTCHLKFNQTQFNWLAKRKEKEVSSEARKVETTPEEEGNFGMRTHFSGERPDYKVEFGLFCDELGGTTELYSASTHDINSKVCKCAIEFEDSFLLAKLAKDDMIANEVKYHSKCRAALYNKARAAKPVCNECIITLIAFPLLN